MKAKTLRPLRSSFVHAKPGVWPGQNVKQSLELRMTAPLKGPWNGTDRVVVIEGIVVYLENVGGIVQDKTIMALQSLLNLSPAEEVFYAHEIRSRRAREEGWREGKLTGKLEGKLEGELKEALALVSKLLTKRFGALSPDVTARLQAATKAELEDIGLRILSASTIQEALGKPKRKRSRA